MASPNRRQSANLLRADSRNSRSPSPANSTHSSSRSRSPRMFSPTIANNCMDRLSPSPTFSNQARRSSTSRRSSTRLDSRSVSPFFRERTWTEKLRQPGCRKSSSVKSLNSDNGSSLDENDSYADDRTRKVISPAKICEMFGIDRGNLPTGSDAFKKALNDMETDFGSITIKVTCE